MRVRFGDVTFDGGRRLVLRRGEPVHLVPKAFRLLELLLAHRPDAVSKGEIVKALWPDEVASEGNLAPLVTELRQALGDRARSPRFVRTVYGFGYAFEGPIREVADSEAEELRHLLVWGKEEIPLAEGDNVLGRQRASGIWVGHPSVSRVHARIRVAGSRAEIEDLGSMNGTWHGKERVTAPVALASGDELRLGCVVLIYLGPGETVSTDTNVVN